MKQALKIRILAAATALVLTSAPAFAFQLKGSQLEPVGTPSTMKVDLLTQVGIDAKMGATLPLELRFKDESGKDVMLRDYFNHGRPVLLAPVYYSCTMLCNQSLNGMTSALNVLKFNAGTEFDVLAVSFDPRDTPELAAEKRHTYLERYKRPGAENGFHFLTGNERDVKALMQSIGFRYAWDENTNQFAHTSTLVLITPDGKISQYYYGIEYSPKDMRLGIIEASKEKVGTVMDQIILFCYHYDPTTGKYGAAAMGALRIGGVATVLLLGGFIFFSVRREKKYAGTLPEGRA